MPRPTSTPEATDRVYTVQWRRRGRCLAADPSTTWRWADASVALKMTLAEATFAAARMGGVVCLDGVPMDKIGAKPPLRPKPIPVPPNSVKSTKADRIRSHIASENWQEAFRLASRIRLGDDTASVERAYQAMTRPEFCRQIKLDPAQLIADGQAILRRRFADGA